MREVDWFFSSLTVLQSADFEMAEDDDIYRMGVMAQFSVTFELAWKALRAVLQLYGVDADTESCRKMLGLGSRRICSRFFMQKRPPQQAEAGRKLESVLGVRHRLDLRIHDVFLARIDPLLRQPAVDPGQIPKVLHCVFIQLPRRQAPLPAAKLTGLVHPALAAQTQQVLYHDDRRIRRRSQKR